MPPTETRAGDSRRDPLWLIVLAALLLAARVGVTVWERANAESAGGTVFPGAPLQPGP